MDSEIDKCVESYRRLKNLKLVGQETGIPWQYVYLNLKSAGEPVNGDKRRYGSETDKFAAKAEKLFNELIPFSRDENGRKFQSKVDFIVKGHMVDVKASNQRNDRWAFSLKKQNEIADFFVLFAFNEDDSYRIILIPGDLCRGYKTLSLAAKTKTKWWDYEVSKDELLLFFEGLDEK